MKNLSKNSNNSTHQTQTQKLNLSQDYINYLYNDDSKVLSKIISIFTTLDKYKCNLFKKFNKNRLNYELENTKWTLLTKQEKIYDEYDKKYDLIVDIKLVEIIKNTYYEKLKELNSAINFINYLLINKNNKIYDIIINHNKDINYIIKSKIYTKTQYYELER